MIIYYKITGFVNIDIHFLVTMKIKVSFNI
jgi:hypothetical protein